MTLTSELRSKRSFVRSFIDAEFPHLKQLSLSLNKQLTAQYPERVQYDRRSSALVGTATDYRIRTYFTDKPHNADAVELGLRKLHFIESIEIEGKEIRNIWHRTGGAIGEILFETFEKSLRDSRLKKRSDDTEDRVCRFCIIFAHLDFVYRTGSFSYCPSEEFLMKIGSTEADLMLKHIETPIVEEVIQLSRLFSSRQANLIQTFNQAISGGVLAGSRDVGGADFDLVIDRCLLEIKTRWRPSIETDTLRQLIGYWLLDYNDKFQIRTAAVYLSRHGHIQRFDVKRDLLRTSRSMRDIRTAFRNKLRRHRDSSTRLSPFYPIETISG